ncbi:MAG: efflux RND transporter periplasmic adaptor subunit [Bacteroidetes bacterium]|nr:efflux RND transporter periplasmic adaptor subunit [Bacteroidota bacterium]
MLNTFLNSYNFPHWTKNKIVWILLFICIILLILILVPDTNADVPIYKISRGSFTIAITESGEIRAKNSISILAPQVRGSIKITYLIPEGTYVKPGDTLCKFDPTETITRFKEAEDRLQLALMDKEKVLADHKASVAQMESQVRSAELSFEQAKIKLDQVKYEAQATQRQAKLEFENSKLSFERTKQEYASKIITNKSDLNRTELNIKQMQNDLMRAKNELSQVVVKAPSNGIVVYGINFSNQQRKFVIGDTPWSGAEILSLPDLSVIESVTNINEVDVSKIRVGQKAIVKLDAFQDSSFTGEVSSVASIGKNKESNYSIKVFEVLISIDRPSEILRPGMTTSNKMIINEIPSELFVPHEAIFEKENKNIVYVKSGLGFDEQEITLGEKSEDFVIVIGLQEGDEVALVDPYMETEQIANGNKNNVNYSSPAQKIP